MKIPLILVTYPINHLSLEWDTEADQEIVRVELPLLGNCWNVTGVLRDVELVTVTVTGI